MKIEHIAMYVEDMEGARAFFEKYFGACANSKYTNEKTGFSSYFLTFEHGARLEIMTKEGIQGEEKPIVRTGYSHVAFSVGRKARVDELTKQLENAGYEVYSGPRTTGDGYYESCVIGFEGNLIEITE